MDDEQKQADAGDVAAEARALLDALDTATEVRPMDYYEYLKARKNFVANTDRVMRDLLAALDAANARAAKLEAEANTIGTTITQAFPDRAFDPEQLPFHVEEIVSALMLCNENEGGAS